MWILGIVLACSGWMAGASRAADVVAGAPATGAKVLVLPFIALNQAEYQPWLGRSIQQSVVADLMTAAPGRIISSESPAADDAAAIDVARKAGAQFVIRGNFASIGGDVRVTGQVLDVSTGKAVTAIKATGPSSNVFAMEDELAAQIRRRLALNPPASDVRSPVATEPPPMEGVRMPAQPAADPYAQTYVAPVQGYNPPTQIEYNYYYSQPTTDYVPMPSFGWVWPSYGYGLGLSYVFPTDYHYHHHWDSSHNQSNNRWNGSYAYGSANSVNGVPIGTGVSTLHAPSGTHNIAGGTRSIGSGRISGGGGFQSSHVGTAHASAPSFHMSTGFGIHAGASMAHH
jgi:TolB-like protein